MTALTRPLHVEGLQPLADRYDLILCDVWGVLHNGVKAYEAASDALTRFRADIAQATRTAWEGHSTDARFIRPDAVAFAKVPSESIDYAVMEPAARAGAAGQATPSAETTTTVHAAGSAAAGGRCSPRR